MAIFYTFGSAAQSVFRKSIGTRLVAADGPKICGGEREGLLKENILVS